MSLYEWITIGIAAVMAVALGALVWRVTHPQ
jgi:uncharacterized membrane-anchored protein YhcB (DUF1043 family)